jgi:hypothetical protein
MWRKTGSWIRENGSRGLDICTVGLWYNSSYTTSLSQDLGPAASAFLEYRYLQAKSVENKISQTSASWARYQSSVTVARVMLAYQLPTVKEEDESSHEDKRRRRAILMSHPLSSTTRVLIPFRTNLFT